MSAIELDVPVLISGDQIRRREFVTIRRGYDADQVRDYLEQLADQVDLMASMIREIRLEAEAAIRTNETPKADPYEQLARRVSSVIREADEAAERIAHEGRRDSERILAEARADAERIRTDAQAKAEEARAQAEHALHDAREQADRTLAGLSTRRQAVVDQLAQMQERLLGVARDLESAIIAPVDEPSTVDDDPAAAATPTAQGPAPIAAAATNGSGRIFDVRDASATAAGSESALDDPAYEDLWDGTEAIGLEVPDIPPLDLSWGEDEGSAEPGD